MRSWDPSFSLTWFSNRQDSSTGYFLSICKLPAMKLVIGSSVPWTLIYCSHGDIFFPRYWTYSWGYGEGCMEDVTFRLSPPSHLAWILSSCGPHFPDGLSSYPGLAEAHLQVLGNHAHKSSTDTFTQWLRPCYLWCFWFSSQKEAVQQGLADGTGLGKGRTNSW